MKICPVGAELLHAGRHKDRQTDRQADRGQTDMTKLTVALRKIAKSA